MKLSGIYGNGAILQRNEWNVISGTDDSAAEITLSIGEQIYNAAVESGRFSIMVPPREAATGLTLTIRGSSTVVLTDICFGDVFMLSGQSNMELPILRVMDVSAEEIAVANDPYIRQYRLTPQYVFEDGDEAQLPDSPWIRAVPGEIDEMSAAGYFFAKRIHEEIGVPIGLILNAQGGSSVEAWMPLDVLDRFGDFRTPLKPFIRRGSLDEFLAERERRILDWYASVQSEDSGRLISVIPADSVPIDLPGLFPAEPAERFSGSVWFYREFSLEKEPGDNAFLYLGELIDSDTTYINGTLVGETGYRYPPRKYHFDATLLRKGRNSIAVRLVIQYGRGGFLPEHPYFIESGTERVELSGSWTYAIERVADRDGVEGFLAQKLPSGLFRAALLPLRGFSMKGILWYQGESNSGEPERYDEKFAAMIAVWRESLAADLPVICVEMADYVDPINGLEKGWSVIQRMQREAPRTTSRCAVASAKDLGAPFELHPQYKSELGKRLSDEALAMIYHS